MIHACIWLNPFRYDVQYRWKHVFPNGLLLSSEFIFFRVNLACFIFQTETKKHLFSLMILFFICQPNSFLTILFCIEYRFDAYFSMCTKYTLIVLTAPFCNFQKRIHPIFICFFWRNNDRFALEFVIIFMVFLADKHLGFRSKINDSYGFISHFNVQLYFCAIIFQIVYRKTHKYASAFIYV